MGTVVGLILGMILLVLGAQGGIRLLADHDNAGILQWLPGGFAAHLAGFLVMVVVGVIVAGRSSAKLRRSGSS